MSAFLAYSENTTEDLLDIAVAIGKAGIVVTSPEDLPKDSSFEGRALQALNSVTAIIVVWPRDDEWTPLLRSAVRIGEERDSLIVIARREVQFGRLFAFHISYVDSGPEHRGLTQAVSKLVDRSAASRRSDDLGSHLSALRIALPPKPNFEKVRQVTSFEDIAHLDVALIEQSDDLTLRNRAEELQHFAGGLQKRSRQEGLGRLFRSGDIFVERYLQQYGNVTPWSMVAISNQTTESELLHHLINRSPAQLLAGRFVVFIVERDHHEVRQKPFQHRLLRENFYFARVNGSPVQDELFDELATYTSRRALRTFSQWMADFRDSQQTAKSEEEALAELAFKTATGPFHFVSYSRDNARDVTTVVDALESLGVRCWFDTRSIPGGEVFVRSITTGLKRCAGVLPFCSIPFSRSVYCLREILFADRLTKPFRPTWLTDPALEDEMLFLLGPYQAVNGSQASLAMVAEKLRQSIA